MHSNSNLALAIPETRPEQVAEASLARLFGGESLSPADAEQLFGELVQGRLGEPAIAAMLIALRFKGETAGESLLGRILGGGQLLREIGVQVHRW